MDRTGFVVWLTGLPAAGKSTAARALGAALESRGTRVEILDGDVVRRALWPELGYSRADRDANIARFARLAALLARHGIAAIVAAISPYRAARQDARAAAGERFIEVFVDTPLEVCEARDPKGLYRRARAGEISMMTGIDDPYEPPARPEVRLTPDMSPETGAKTILEYLDRRGWLGAIEAGA